MSDRDRLIELFEQMDRNPEITCPKPNDIEFCEKCQYNINGMLCKTLERKVDYLLANGVFILPEDLRGAEDFSISAFIEAMQMYKEKDRYIKPPCKVGDTVYYRNRSYHIELKKDTIYEAKVVRIVITSLGTSLIIQIRGEWGCIQQSNVDCIETPDVKDFDRTVFLTKEEAKKALVERKTEV